METILPPLTTQSVVQTLKRDPVTWTHIHKRVWVTEGTVCPVSYLKLLLFAASGQCLGKHGFPQPQCSPIEGTSYREQTWHLQSNTQASWIHVPPAELHPVLLSIACVPD